MTHSKGISWIDDCRIPFVDNIDLEKSIGGTGSIFNTQETGKKIKIIPKSEGRFPANILVSDDMLNDGVIQISKRGKERDSINKGYFGGGIKNNTNEYTDKGSNSRYYNIDKWFENLIK
jgi:hypothetical protein